MISFRILAYLRHFKNYVYGNIAYVKLTTMMSIIV